MRVHSRVQLLPINGFIINDHKDRRSYLLLTVFVLESIGHQPTSYTIVVREGCHVIEV